MSGFVEVLPPELTGPDHPEWFECRRRGVTASEIAAILGLAPRSWSSAFKLYWQKQGAFGEDPDQSRTRWGRRLERHIADEFAERHPELLITGAGLYAHAERPWEMASPDRLVYDPVAGELTGVGFGETARVTEGDPVAAVECKAWNTWDGWGEKGTDEVPVHIRAQAIWQADVLGVPCVYVPVANGSDYREYVVQHDPEDAAVMRKAAVEFLDRLRRNDPPDVDGSDATIFALKRLHPEIDDTEAEVPGKLAAQWLGAARAEKRAKERRKAAEAKLRDRMGRARVAVHDGEKVATRVISTVKEHVRAESTRDYLNPPREKP